MSEAIEQLSNRLLALIKSVVGGISNNEIVKKFPEYTAQQRVAGLNKLLEKNLVDLLQKGDQLYYRIKDTKTAPATKVTDTEDKIVYNIIENSGNKGIWIRDIRIKSNLSLTQLNKVLKSLESKKLIKAVKSVNASKKKVYMLFNLEPDRSVTGGAWYQDQDFESEFVDVLNQQCLRFLQQKSEKAKELKDGPIAIKKFSYCSVQEVHKFIKELGISKISLDEEDLETILKTVVYDGKAERALLLNGTYVYRAVESPIEPPGIVQITCGLCPIIKLCSLNGEVNPKSCQYMDEWLG